MRFFGPGSDVSAKVAVPRAPAKLNAAGRALWRRLHLAPEPGPDGTHDVLQFEPREQAVLELACRQADDVARLEAAIRERGLVTKGSTGQPRLSPMLAEVRQSRLALNRLLSELKLPEFDAPAEGAAPPASGRSRQARAAARKRWANHRERMGETEAGHG